MNFGTLNPLCLLSLFLFSYYCVPLPAQDAFDSLYQEIKQARSPDEKVASYEQLLNYLNRDKDERLLSISDELLAFARQNNHPRGIGLAHEIRAGYYSTVADYEQALADYEAARQAYLDGQLLPEAVNCLAQTYIVYYRTGQAEQQLEVLEEAKQLAAQAGDDNSQGMIYRMEGIGLIRSGERTAGLEKYNQAIEKFRQAGHDFNLAKTLLSKGSILKTEKSDEALELLKEAAAIGKQLDNPHFMLYVNMTLLQLYRSSGDYNRSIEIAVENIHLAEKIGDTPKIIISCIDLGSLYADMDDFEQASYYHEQAIEKAGKVNYPGVQWNAHDSYGLLLLRSTKIEQAIQHFEKALIFADSSSDKFLRVNTLNNLGFAYLDLGDPEKAAPVFQEALKLNAGEDLPKKYKSFTGLGEIYIQKKQNRKAIEYSEAAYAFAKEEDNVSDMSNNAWVLFTAHKGLSNYEKALQWHESYLKYKDILKDEENLRKITTLKLTADFEKEKEAIALEQQQKETLLKAQTRHTRIITAGVGFLALLGFGFFWNVRRKNKVIAAQNLQLEQLNRTKDRIFSIIGHDLRKPAIAFRGITQKVNYLLKKQDYTTLERLGNEIESDALALNKLTDNLLNWALMQKNVMPYQPCVLQVAGIATEEMALFQKSAAEKKVTLISNIPEGLSVFADGNALHTIIRNLLDNAVKYTPEGGRVEIAAEEGTDGVKIVVSDTGIGMPQDKLKDIFLLQDGKSEKGTAGEKGTGLGLHLVHELVQLNKGSVKAVSRLEQGMRFEVSMPRRLDAA